MKNKVIDKKIPARDHYKTLDSIYPVLPKQEFKGCLFIHDSSFERCFPELLNNKLSFRSGMNLKLYLSCMGRYEK